MWLWWIILLDIVCLPEFSAVSVLVYFLDHSAWKTWSNFHSLVILSPVILPGHNSSTSYLLGNWHFFLLEPWPSPCNFLLRYCPTSCQSPLLLPCSQSLFPVLETEMPYIPIPIPIPLCTQQSHVTQYANNMWRRHPGKVLFSLKNEFKNK